MGSRWATNYIIAILITIIKGVGVSDSSSRQLVCRPTNATTLKTLLTHYYFTIQASRIHYCFTLAPTQLPTYFCSTIQACTWKPLLLHHTSKHISLLFTPSTQLHTHYHFTIQAIRTHYYFTISTIFDNFTFLYSHPFALPQLPNEHEYFYSFTFICFPVQCLMIGIFKLLLILNCSKQGDLFKMAGVS